MSRLTRKHSHLWGLSALDNTAIVSGLEHALDTDERTILIRVRGKDKKATTGAINSRVLARMRSRAQSYADWRVGEPYAWHEQELIALQAVPSNPVVSSGPSLAILLSIFFTGMLVIFSKIIDLMTRSSLRLDFVTVPLIAAGFSAVLSSILFGPSLVRGIRHRARPAALYRGAAIVIARTLHEAGRTEEFGESNIVVRQYASRSGHEDERDLECPRITVEINGGSLADRRAIADSLEELFAPVRNPRFLIRVDRGSLGLLNKLFTTPLALLDRVLQHRTLLAVPTLIGRRRADAERFRHHWENSVGACTLHELGSTDDLLLLRSARASQCRLDPLEPRNRSWG